MVELCRQYRYEEINMTPIDYYLALDELEQSGLSYEDTFELLMELEEAESDE